MDPNFVGELYRTESRRIFATLVRLLGDFDLAEEALAEAFRAALEQWPGEGIPENPRAWLVSTGRFKAIDAIRRRARFDPLEEEHAETLAAESPEREVDEIEDDRLRLIFTRAFAPGAGTAVPRAPARRSFIARLASPGPAHKIFSGACRTGRSPFDHRA